MGRYGLGGNFYQLGDSTMAQKNSPTQVGTATDWIFINAGFKHNMALKANHSLWVWGHNSTRQIGGGTVVNKPVLWQVGKDLD